MSREDIEKNEEAPDSQRGLIEGKKPKGKKKKKKKV